MQTFSLIKKKYFIVIFKRLEPQSNNNAVAAGSEYASFSSVRNDYERGDIVLGDDVKKHTNVNADYGVLPVNDGYISLPSVSDGYGVMPMSSK